MKNSWRRQRATGVEAGHHLPARLSRAPSSMVRSGCGVASDCSVPSLTLDGLSTGAEQRDVHQRCHQVVGSATCQRGQEHQGRGVREVACAAAVHRKDGLGAFGVEPCQVCSKGGMDTRLRARGGTPVCIACPSLGLTLPARTPAFRQLSLSTNAIDKIANLQGFCTFGRWQGPSRL